MLERDCPCGLCLFGYLSLTLHHCLGNSDRKRSEAVNECNCLSGFCVNDRTATDAGDEELVYFKKANALHDVRDLLLLGILTGVAVIVDVTRDDLATKKAGSERDVSDGTGAQPFDVGARFTMSGIKAERQGAGLVELEKSGDVLISGRVDH